jgi:RNA polymerase sigma factor for flagellar operon FliA
MIRRAARKIMLTIPPNAIEYDELVQAGLLGLWRAIKSESAETPHLGYLYKCIVGEMREYLRNADWMPRSERHKIKKINRAIDDLMSALWRRPSAMEIAKSADMTLDEYHRTLHLSNANEIESDTNSITGYTVETPDFGCDPMEMAELSQTISAIVDIIDNELTDIEREALSKYYDEGKPMLQVGREMGCTESNACVTIKRAVKKVRKALI